MKFKWSAVLKLLRKHDGEPVAFRDIVSHCGIGKSECHAFRERLDRHVTRGDVRKLKGNRYTLADETGKGPEAGVTGKLSVHRDGYGFVIPDGGGEDIFIPARYLRGNMHGDRVEVHVVPHGRDRKREGKITRTLERGFTKVVGRFYADRAGDYIVPDELRLPRVIRIPAKGRGDARDGQVVLAEITFYPTGQQCAEGKIVEVLGQPDDPDTEALMIIRKYDLPDLFSDDALASARTVPQTITQDQAAGRVDLRGFLTVTIDGETARDFDDAVSVGKEGGGKVRLRVSIADVAHYVQPGTALDTEAYLRGTSVYFPDRCLPMLPEELSNGICSLNPQVDRLTLTAEMLFDKTGALLEKKIYPSVIRSSARLTYTTVKRLLVDEDPDMIQAHQGLFPDLKTMEELARRLMARRRQRGSIDFDLPEPEIILDLQGQTEAIIRAERNLAHRIIEEFMLAANETVASFLEERDIPSLYRVHEPPDPVKLNDFREFIYNFGYALRLDDDNVEPGELQRLLDQAEGKPEERMINEVLLRCMKQARYAAENLGHFGLASPSYTHFTSPIRRYPDLVVHRILKRTLNGKMNVQYRERLVATLPEIAAHTSTRERNAMEAEREIVALKKVQFMRDRVGEEFGGFISGVSAHGFFVELVDLFVEGMVHVSSLGNDFYRYAEKEHALRGERTGKIFRIGDRIAVRVANVSIERKQIDFVMADAPGTSPSQFIADGEYYPKIPVKGKRPPTRKSGEKGRLTPGGKAGKGRQRQPRKKR